MYLFCVTAIGASVARKTRRSVCVKAFDPNELRDDRGRWSGGGMTGTLAPPVPGTSGAGDWADPLDQHLVDYLPNRPLSDPRVDAAIANAIPGSTVVPYDKTPFFDQVNQLQGTPHPTMQTDPVSYELHRNALFNAQPIKDVPITGLVLTQYNVNKSSVNWGVAHYDATATGHEPYAVADGDHTYLLDGHHRVVAAALTGATSLPMRVLDLNEPSSIQPPLPLAARPVFGNAPSTIHAKLARRPSASR